MHILGLIFMSMCLASANLKFSPDNVPESLFKNNPKYFGDFIKEAVKDQVNSENNLLACFDKVFQGKIDSLLVNVYKSFFDLSHYDAFSDFDEFWQLFIEKIGNCDSSVTLLHKNYTKLSDITVNIFYHSDIESAFFESFKYILDSKYTQAGQQFRHIIGLLKSSDNAEKFDFMTLGKEIMAEFDGTSAGGCINSVSSAVMIGSDLISDVLKAIEGDIFAIYRLYAGGDAIMKPISKISSDCNLESLISFSSLFLNTSFEKMMYNVYTNREILENQIKDLAGCRAKGLNCGKIIGQIIKIALKQDKPIVDLDKILVNDIKTSKNQDCLQEILKISDELSYVIEYIGHLAKDILTIFETPTSEAFNTSLQCGVPYFFLSFGSIFKPDEYISIIKS